MARRHFTCSPRSPHLIRRRPTLECLESRCLLAAITMLDTEQLVIELTNRARANPAEEAARLGIGLNDGLPAGTISTSPKPPLAPHQILIDVAAAHSQDMIDRDFFAHVNPDGENPGDRIADAGYPAWSWGENLAVHIGAAEAHDLLFTSAGHRDNMLRDTYREIGVGVRDRADWGVDMTEAFAYRKGDAFLTGVAFSDQFVADNFFSLGESLAGVTIAATATIRGTTYTTTTGPSGGYSLQVPSDTYDLVASGGELGNPITITGIGIGTKNVKVDFVVPYDEPGEPLPPVANEDRVMTEKGVAVVIDVLLNDSGSLPLNPATLTIVSPPNVGQVIVDQATGRITYTPADGGTGPDEFTYRFQGAGGDWSPAGRVLVTVVDLGSRPWQNPHLAPDVNADHRIAALDALMLITNLNSYQARELPTPSIQADFPPAYWDVNGDGHVDAQDVLGVINQLNSVAAGEGEASSDVGGIETPAFPAAAPVLWDVPDAVRATPPISANPVAEADSRIWPVATLVDGGDLPVRPDRSRPIASQDYEPAFADDDVLFSADLLQAIDAIAGR